MKEYIIFQCRKCEKMVDTGWIERSSENPDDNDKEIKTVKYYICKECGGK